MMKWLKLAKFFVTAPSWVKWLTVVVALLLLPLTLILLPVFLVLGLVLLLVFAVVALIVSPARSLLHRTH